MDTKSSAFNKLCASIREELFVSSSVVVLSFLREKMKTLMTSKGTDTKTDSTKKKNEKKTSGRLCRFFAGMY